MNNFLNVVMVALIIFFLFKMVGPLAGITAFVIVLAVALYLYVPTYYASKGNQAFNAGDFKGAVAWYKKCMANRAKVNHRINYAYMLMRVGEFEEAEKVLDYILRFKSVKPEHRNAARQHRCMVYYKQGRLDEAVEEAQTAYDNGFRTSVMRATLGFFKLVTAPKAQETYEFCLDAYDYDDENRDIKDNMILAYYYQGEYEKAKEISDKVMEENPQFVEAYYHGAMIEEKLGNYKKAKEYLEKTEDCRWSDMTTVTKDEVAAFIKEIEKKI